MKTILITGGAGFIGSDFVRYRHDNHQEYRILGLDSPTFADNPGDVPERT